LPLSFHDRTTPGQLLSRLESDTQALRMLFTTTAVMLLGDFLMMLGMAGVMVWHSPRLTLITGSALPLMILVTVYFQKGFHHRFVEVRQQNSVISSRLAELIQAIPLLQAYARHRWATSRLQEITRKKYDTQAIAEWYVIVWFNLIFVIETLALCLILGVGGAWALSGAVTIGLLAMFMGYVRRFFDPLHRLAEQLATIQKAFASAERVLKLLEEPNTVPDPARPVSFSGLKREIRFERVWFRYTDAGEWVLKDVSFTLPVGENWALVGPTGSGKTTIVSLLLRFYDPQEGRVLIDGVDLRELLLDAYRQRLGMVLQDLYLFPGNLRENLAMGRDVSDAMLKQAAEITLADRFIRHLPKGDQTDLAERGGNLSVGQRQLLSFTRALAGDPDLLILDEATSAVDPATENLLSLATRRVLKGRTALIIAHRLSTIRHCHRILVLQHGEIIEQGTHAELLATGGLYRTLHALQFSEQDHTPKREGTKR
jgi:ATP-binding cassette subfamily B protein